MSKDKFTPITVVRCLTISADYSDEQLANATYDVITSARSAAIEVAKEFGHKVTSEQINTNIVPKRHYGQEMGGYSIVITYVGQVAPADIPLLK